MNIEKAIAKHINIETVCDNYAAYLGEYEYIFTVDGVEICYIVDRVYGGELRNNPERIDNAGNGSMSGMIDCWERTEVEDIDIIVEWVRDVETSKDIDYSFDSDKFKKLVI